MAGIPKLLIIFVIESILVGVLLNTILSITQNSIDTSILRLTLFALGTIGFPFLAFRFLRGGK